MIILEQLPHKTAVSKDDGRCNHLLEQRILNVSLDKTDGTVINWRGIKRHLVIPTSHKNMNVLKWSQTN